MKSYEYKTVWKAAYENNEWEKVLNTYGQEGFRVVQVLHDTNDKTDFTLLLEKEYIS